MTLRITLPAASPRTVARCCLLATAIACLGTCGYAYLERILYQSYESREFDRAADVSQVPSLPAAKGNSSRPATRKAAGGSTLIGRLSVPRLHLSAMVREGIDPGTLQLAIGHFPATALPGQAGNVGVAGHRDTFFRGLKDLKNRDEIHFSTRSGDFKYVVDSMAIVEPEDVGVLAPSSENVLTLVTCYPFSYIGAAPRRFVVRARQVAPLTAPPVTVE